MASNFSFLQQHDPIFYQLAHNAETVFAVDPNTTLIKLRQFGEAVAQEVATGAGIFFDERTSQKDLLFRIHRDLNLDPLIKDVFHHLRIEGNRATHRFKTKHKEAMDGLRVARQLAIWFHKSSDKCPTDFKPGPFVPPEDPSAHHRTLQKQIQQLQAELNTTHQQLESNQQLTQLLQQEKEEYAVLAEQMDKEARQYKSLFESQDQALEKQQAEFTEKLARAQKQEQTESEKQARKQKQKTYAKQLRAASKALYLNEEVTRIVIDQHLIEAGWETDTETLTYKNGSRPEKGKNMAIAEWPTEHEGKKGYSDYVLFKGLTPMAVVEAKKENTNVAGKIGQAERYSKGFDNDSTLIPAWQLEGRTIAWPVGEQDHYHVPFVYSSNGRPFVKQLAEQSGIWFRDVREHSNIARSIANFHSPQGLEDKLTRRKEAAQQKLQQEGFGYLKLRDYQEKAIRCVETALAQDAQQCLLAMATGTGKTRTIIGLMYRFLKAERFKRILFLVDRTSLGTQALDSFNEAPLEESKPLSKIYNINELGDMAAEAETRIQVATVQAMVKRLFMSDTPPPVDEFDCIIVDEAHRGYTLDQEMTEGELETRDAAQYLSSYRRVLDYFDATRIGLTATPAKHTTEIFGKPVYTYSYPEAVADDWLIDHEPPIRYQTRLSRAGIKFEKGEEVSAINTGTGEVEAAELDDEVSFAVDAFNRRVINENFNRVICEELVKELDPFSEEKTMIFCVTDRHADMVKRLLDESFKALYNGDYNQASVLKITGQTDKVETAISCFKNEDYPNIAITVDLLTTGIDVPKICNLVFMRRVRSRILYEQMVGRATRRCDDIGKTVFRIYDPVDLYAALEEVSTMKPLVKNPNVTIEQLVEELTDDKHLTKALNTKGEAEGHSYADDLLDQLSQKAMRILRKAKKKAESRPEIKEKLDELTQLWGTEADKLPQHLRKLGSLQAAAFIKDCGGLLPQLNAVNLLLGSERYPLISEHEDALEVREQNYGNFNRPEDYLGSFEHFIKHQINESVALSTVVNKPKDLTREQLKEVRLMLDAAGFGEKILETAWKNKTNQDIAASIVGYIRQAAIGEALMPFADRVQLAMQNIYQLHHWAPAQRKWLERLAKQLTHEVVVDKHFINQRFATHGGTKTLNKVLNDKLDDVLSAVNDALWPEQA